MAGGIRIFGMRFFPFKKNPFHLDGKFCCSTPHRFYVGGLTDFRSCHGNFQMSTGNFNGLGFIS
jgi:hypothetical protein